MRAFRMMEANQFTWCRTNDLLTDSSGATVNTCQSEYEDFVTAYLEYEDGIQYWDRLLFHIDSDSYVIHTAYAHILYVGKLAFIEEISIPVKPRTVDGWLNIVGSHYEDPDLKTAYGLS